MNTPTHLIAGAVTAQLAMLAVGKHPRQSVRVAGAVGCFIIATGTHLGLDLLPHYNWIIYLKWFHQLPFAWLIREGVLSVPVMIFAIYCGYDHPVINAIGLVGSIYPDFEKVAYLDFHLSERFLLFPWHSLRATAPWPQTQTFLIGLELTIFVVLMLATIGLSVWRRRSTTPMMNDLILNSPPVAEAAD